MTVAVIVAGGRATRLGPLAAQVPKCLLPVGGRTVLDHQLRALAPVDPSHTIVAAGHLAEQVRDHVAGRGVDVHVEAVPRGSGGAVRDAIGAIGARRPRSGDEVVVLLGDVLTNADLRALVAAHRAASADATVLVHPNDHPYDSDLVECDADGRIVALHPKPHPAGIDRQNLVIAGAYVLAPHVVDGIDAERPSDLSQDVIGGLVASGAHVLAHRSCAYVKDMGTPSRYARVEEDWRNGTVAARAPGVARPGVILDRDGTIVHRAGLVTDPDQIVVPDEVARAIAACNRAGLLVAVATNQSVLARGLLDGDGLRRVHARVETRLGEHGAWIDGWFVCPHHPDAGYPGEVAALKVACTCRKPATGLLEQAMRELPFDRDRTIFLGDASTDVEAGRRAGLATRLVDVGPDPRRDAVPTAVAVRAWLEACVAQERR